MEGRWNSVLRCTQRIRSRWIFPIETIHILVCVCVFIICSVSFSLFYFVPVVGLFVLCVCWHREFIANTEGEGLFPFFLHDVSAITYWIVGIHKRSCTENERVTKEKAEGGSFKMNEKDFCISPFFFFRIDKTPDTIVCTRTSRYGTILRLPIFVGIPAFVSVFLDILQLCWFLLEPLLSPPQSIVNKRTRRGTWQKLIASFKV